MASCAQRLAASKIVSLSVPRLSLRVSRCSTPCGIKDSFTSHRSPTTDPSKSAQRLAASKIVSHSLADTLIARKRLCSTPCGIKDSFTLRHAAFRDARSRCSTPCGIKDSFTHPPPADTTTPPSSAQRLAASKIVSPVRRIRLWFESISAQRLAASKIVSHEYRCQSIRGQFVLNALRHQR